MFSNFGTSKKPKPSYYLPNRISNFFSVFKMIGREHQASLNLPSFGFSKVRNLYLGVGTRVTPQHTRIIIGVVAEKKFLHFGALVF